MPGAGCEHMKNAMQGDVLARSCAKILLAIQKEKEARRIIRCSECREQANWEVCVQCGEVFCRTNSHAQKHRAQRRHEHFFCARNGLVFCEPCGAFIEIDELVSLSNIFHSPGIQARDLFKMDVPSEQRLRHGSTEFSKLPVNSVKGFINLKKTCYINSLLQCILSFPEFVSSLLGWGHARKGCAVANCLVCSLNNVIYQLYSDKTPCVNVSHFLYRFWKEFPSFAESNYQDVQEFFLYLGSKIHLSFPKMQPRAGLGQSPSGRCPCPIHAVFGGTYRSVLRCASCGTRHVSSESYTTLSLDLCRDSLSEIVQLYTKEEEVQFGRGCSNCGLENSYTKQLVLDHLPRILCIHLKRYSVSNNVAKKIGRIVTYEELLCVAEKRYRLSSVISHTGELESGHYVSYLRKNGSWYEANDESVRKELDPLRVLNTCAYVLFYTME